VLIVDDEEAIRFGVSEALRLSGYDVESVGDGEQALARLAARRFEAVLSDIRSSKTTSSTRARRRSPGRPTTSCSR
jgi:DNA-binding NtrC family response regulator